MQVSFVVFLLTLNYLAEVRANASQKFGCRLVVAGCNSSLGEDLLTKLRVTDAKRKLLLFGCLG
jgi:hypothetical protein